MKKEIKDILSIAATLFGFTFLIPIVAIGCLFLLVFFEPNLLDSTGDFQCVVSCTDYGFRDGTAYREYHYSRQNFDSSRFFQPVSLHDIGRIQAFVKDYEGCIALKTDNPTPDAQGLYQSYGYDLSSLSVGDYFCLQVKDTRRPFENYDIYIFDTEGMTLYHLENDT